MSNLTFDQLHSLLMSVFRLDHSDTGWLAILIDLPDARRRDNDLWKDRRAIAAEWFKELSPHAHELPFSAIVFCAYPNVGSNNNDLPESMVVAEGLPEFDLLPRGKTLSTTGILRSSSVLLSLTEFSATAPLKLLAKDYSYRGATMPGFQRKMLPTLLLDYEAVHNRVVMFKERMDRASGFRVSLEANGKVFESFFDLRFRTGHASGGLIREKQQVGNLPSGEAYIVPYEGERTNTRSLTEGILPVQFGEEVVLYKIRENRAFEVVSDGEQSDLERGKLAEEPAYGNIAEVGIGVLGEWGVTAVGSTLLDEKLGLHIAFGRSDHFGGTVGPSSFKNKDNVIHIDRVYVKSMQPVISVANASLVFGGEEEQIIAEDKYLI